MKKLVSILLLFATLLSCFMGACGEGEGDIVVPELKGERVLRICNCEDYIDEELLDEFEQKFDCEIVYSTFGTPRRKY